ncbi:MAG: 4-phosphopantetheinyl transferase family protein [Flavobacteriaceae bacterium]|nr:4-phosphopantetheinyl transferase family protein [Flavobacteriaceae bacterium]
MIGNDIIDLRFAETESNWQRKGFLDKQFTSREQVVIKSSEDPFMKVWQFWSMKEAAYKIYTQLTEERFFAPKKFECELTSGSKGIVCFQNQKFYTTSILNRTYIFTVAGLEKEIKNSSSIGLPNEIDQSIKRKLQKETGISISEIEQRKSKIGAPNYYHKNKRLTKSCAISHHGNYGAFSLLYT